MMRQRGHVPQSEVACCATPGTHRGLRCRHSTMLRVVSLLRLAAARAGRRSRRHPFGRHGLVVTLVALLCCTACVTLPEDGAVQVGSAPTATEEGVGFPYDPRPPAEGESPTDVVRHFFDAMTASPISTAVARQFLTESAREAWKPDAAMITYDDVSTPIGANDVEVELSGANLIDDRGAWAGALAGEDARLTFALTTENGEWRIADLPDAMIVPETWFEDRYSQKALHFFDPTGEVLVGEPVFVPRGGQEATALLRGLLRGPARNAVGVEQSFIPEGLSLDVLVPAPVDGVAEVALRGDVPAPDAETLQLMTVQLAWTLRQVPGITRFRLTLNGVLLNPGNIGTGGNINVAIGEPYDPAVSFGWQDGFALRDNRLVMVTSGGESVVGGPFGDEALDARSLGVNLPGTLAALVAEGGTGLYVADVEGDDPRARVLQGADLLKPAWDHTGALWVVDRTSSGARVLMVEGGRDGVNLRSIRVPGVTGETVRSFLVSRDGSRLVAIVRGRDGDRVLVSRLRRTHSTVSGTPATVVWEEPGERLVLRDLGWRTPTEVLVVRALDSELSQVVRRSVDGSSSLARGTSATELVRDRIRRVVSSPVSGRPAWAVGRRGVLHLVASDFDSYVPRPGLTALTYVG